MFTKSKSFAPVLTTSIQLFSLTLSLSETHWVQMNAKFGPDSPAVWPFIINIHSHAYIQITKFYR